MNYNLIYIYIYLFILYLYETCIENIHLVGSFTSVLLVAYVIIILSFQCAIFNIYHRFIVRFPIGLTSFS